MAAVLALKDMGPHTQAQPSAPSTKEINDTILVQRAVDGDEAAFARLVARYQNRIYNFTYRYCNDAHEAHDITQEVFIKAYKNLDKFRGEAKFSTWLYQIAKNVSINQIRKVKRRMRYMWTPHANADDDQEPIWETVADDSIGHEETLIRNEQDELVREAIRHLSSTYRAALILRDIEGLAYDEIAQVLGLAEGTVKSRIHRARSELKQRLDGMVAPR